MRIIIAGGSGYLGRVLTGRLIADGHDVTIISRTGRTVQGAKSARWTDDLVALLDGTDAVVNMAGANVGARRWSSAYRREMVDSRCDTTRTVVDALLQCVAPPALVSLSGTGYYGNSMTPVNEGMGAGATFLAELCDRWEAEARRADAVTRVVILRMAPILDPADGMLAKLMLPMKLFVGGTLGSGLQWVPWIHRDDAVEALRWAVVTPRAHGPYNVAGPEVVTMRTFIRTLGRVLARPTILPVPSIILRILLGHMADTVLHGQRVAPWRLEGDGCVIRHRTLEGALRDLVG